MQLLGTLVFSAVIFLLLLFGFTSPNPALDGHGGEGYPWTMATGASAMVLGLWLWGLSRLQQVTCRPREGRDPVTGLLMHSSLHQQMERLFEEATRLQHPLCIIRLDIDRFALFNSIHGHSAGDDLLRRVAEVLKQSLPPRAVVGRYDADEFLIVLPHTSREAAVSIAQQFNALLRQRVLAWATNGQVIPVTASIGIACFPADADSVQTLLSVAEEALSSARLNGSGVADAHSSWRLRYQVRENGSFSTLEAMVIAIDNKDHYTRKHSEEVTDYALWIAEELGLSEAEKHQLRLAGLVHDVGKIGIPDEVLQKPDVLTSAEYEAMKQHAVMGAVMLAALPNMSILAPIVRAHHERWDGKGYPDGLSGEQIPFLARILAVADAYSAMTSDRPYRRGMDKQSAIAELQRQRGKQFDPVIVDAFVRVLRRMDGERSDEQAVPKAA